MFQMDGDVTDGPPSYNEDQQRLLRDARATCDAFVQEKLRVESLLNTALEKVKIYQAQLGATESQICRAEDLIGVIRFQLRQNTFTINPPTSRSLLTPETSGSEGVTNE